MRARDVRRGMRVQFTNAHSSQLQFGTVDRRLEDDHDRFVVVSDEGDHQEPNASMFEQVTASNEALANDLVAARAWLARLEESARAAAIAYEENCDVDHIQGERFTFPRPRLASTRVSRARVLPGRVPGSPSGVLRLIDEGAVGPDLEGA